MMMACASLTSMGTLSGCSCGSSATAEADSTAQPPVEIDTALQIRLEHFASQPRPEGKFAFHVYDLTADKPVYGYCDTLALPSASCMKLLTGIAALELLGSVLSFRSQKFFNFLSGRPKTVILDGKIDQNALRMLRLTTADLMEALRGKNIFDPREVSYAVIETNGTLSAALRPEKEPVRLSDLQIKVNHANAIIPFVLDGQVLEDNLRWCGKDREWLERTAQANTLLPEEILLLIGSETEDYFLLKKEDRHGSGPR